MPRSKKKSSRAAILEIRWRRIVNGQRDSNETSPVFIRSPEGISKVSAAQWANLKDQAVGLSYFAGEEVDPSSLVKSRKRRKKSNKRTTAATTKLKQKEQKT